MPSLGVSSLSSSVGVDRWVFFYHCVLSWPFWAVLPIFLDNVSHCIDEPPRCFGHSRRFGVVFLEYKTPCPGTEVLNRWHQRQPVHAWCPRLTTTLRPPRRPGFFSRPLDYTIALLPSSPPTAGRRNSYPGSQGSSSPSSVVFVLVIFTFNRYFYPTLSALPPQQCPSWFFILVERCKLCGQWDRETKKSLKNPKEGKSSASVPSTWTQQKTPPEN